ncbi:MAG TPA: dicarboxylate/amino acid:cation symporter, partial [Tissierellaceae bacterium]|nr:dicarboxylate/amino acid:cation symporter [Tissierellaceae bacterium]
MSKLRDNLVVKLLIALIIGIVLGLVANESVIGVIQSIKHVVGQFIFFCVPLVIIGFIAPSITGL